MLERREVRVDVPSRRAAEAAEMQVGQPRVADRPARDADHVSAEVATWQAACAARIPPVTYAERAEAVERESAGKEPPAPSGRGSTAFVGKRGIAEAYRSTPRREAPQRDASQPADRAMPAKREAAAIDEAERSPREGADERPRICRPDASTEPPGRPVQARKSAAASARFESPTASMNPWPELPPLPWASESRFEDERPSAAARLKRLELEQRG
jgi:hypothetical protein